MLQFFQRQRTKVKKMGKKALKAKGKRSDIHDAAHLGNINQIKELLIRDPEQRNIQDEHDWTALHWASAAGQVDAVILLLNWGADPNSVDDRLVTPLHLALRGGYIQVAMRLIERGAEPWRLNSRSENCLHSCIKLGNSDPQACDTLTSVILYHRKYHPAKFIGMMNAKESHSLTPLQFAKETNAPASVVLKLTEVKIPEEEHVITVLLHGWNDKIADWEQIEQNFNSEVQLPFHLFKYDSLANRVSIETLAKDLYNFINEKLDLYYKEKAVTFTRLTAGGANKSVNQPDKDINCAVNIICYSTGGLIVRTFMQNYYRNSFRSRISRVIFLAPANFGSPFAKFGKSSVGRLYTGKWNLGSLFECGEELLTRFFFLLPLLLLLPPLSLLLSFFHSYSPSYSPSFPFSFLFPFLFPPFSPFHYLFAPLLSSALSLFPFFSLSFFLLLLIPYFS